MALGNSQYRLWDLLLFGGGLMLLGSHFGLALTGWAPWLMAAITGGIIGVLVSEWNNGAGAGGLVVGLGGALFVVLNNVDQGVGNALRFGLFMFALFGLVGMMTGGITGYIRQQAAEDVAEEVEESVDS